ncbi:STAS domain-containing protein [uncultured Mailhella sp.]|uniref:STAS domain-containing protein n=1 Tax=uncultured Mailhella sp. TaxID=1981031 RepID=UPI00261BFCC4|nr:STAS domain-containing protein [uncultured Mailhella sp.]
MLIENSVQDGISVIKVSGRMDATTTPQFNEECQKLLSAGTGRFIIDLSGLEYISSAGLRGILVMGKACKASGSSLAFCSMQAMVADMFKLSGFTSILNVYASLDEALAAMR